jgi:hypothetical protein
MGVGSIVPMQPTIPFFLFRHEYTKNIYAYFYRIKLNLKLYNILNSKLLNIANEHDWEIILRPGCLTANKVLVHRIIIHIIVKVFDC